MKIRSSYGAAECAVGEAKGVVSVHTPCVFSLNGVVDDRGDHQVAARSRQAVCLSEKGRPWTKQLLLFGEYIWYLLRDDQTRGHQAFFIGVVGMSCDLCSPSTELATQRVPQQDLQHSSVPDSHTGRTSWTAFGPSGTNPMPTLVLQFLVSMAITPTEAKDSGFLPHRAGASAMRDGVAGVGVVAE